MTPPRPFGPSIARSVDALWWPALVFVYPLLWAPWSPDRPAAYLVHVFAAAVFVVGGLALEAWHEARHGPDGSRRQAVRRWPPLPVLIATAFVLWVCVSALRSPDAGFALTGTLTEHANGAYEYVLLLVLFVLVFRRARRDRRLARRIALALVASSLLLAVLDLVEVVLRHPLLHPGLGPSVVPLVSFPQRGHLAGMLAFGAGAAVGLDAVLAGFVGVFTLALGIGATLDRAAMLALLVPLLVGARRRLRRGLALAAVVVIGVALGALLTQARPGGPRKDIESGSSLASRSYLYRAAVRGILARPLFGWGGGTFEMHWTDFLSRQELSRLLGLEYGLGKVVRVMHAPGSYALVAVHPEGSKPGTLKVLPTGAWHAHNQFLEVGLESGVVGLALYLLMLFYGLRGVARGQPLSLALLAYVVFLQAWFVIPETRAVLWAVWAAAAGSSEPTSRGAAAADAVDGEEPSTA